ncbi:hypothetical protein [Tardiphaga sp. 285_C5_N1_2]|uniref:hypothetical protein n=1 Tax=Tardiphaga sp. 285_C5_N1_2 TaxID=3240775 RepID=UPI003F8867E4
MTKPPNTPISHQAVLIRQLGEEIHGLDWQAPLCAAIGVSPRSMRRWVSGEDPIPRGVLVDIHRHAEARWTPIKYFDDELAKLLSNEILDPLQPVPNGSLLPDSHGLAFAMKTGAGRAIRCYIRREVLDDRVKTNPFAKVTKYFSDHADAFYVAAQRKFDAGDYDDAGIVISNVDVLDLDLPDERWQ